MLSIMSFGPNREPLQKILQPLYFFSNSHTTNLNGYGSKLKTETVNDLYYLESVYSSGEI